MGNSKSIIEEKRKTMCKVGTRKTKLFLNEMARNDIVANIYRVALEAVDASICADAYNFNSQTDYYNRNKIVNVCRLQELYQKHNYCWRMNKDNYGRDYICFYLPLTEKEIRFPWCGLPEIIGVNTESNLINNLKKVEESIWRIYEDSLISKYNLKTESDS